ncbi:hypothetical protein CCHL11_01092 [Colletotrichum chlorophyti]|uniref:Glycosyltransferase family 31 protein n=1 Tax=Colletotrichum chlorophyti TaxID=708187 RepID=A0A1Q8S7B6_9PEZI|nr:hypothetical protein CCHL11_01092 [Colletotrichum chlorophyti]
MGTIDTMMPTSRVQQPLYAYQNHARALHAATFLLVLLIILVQIARSRQDTYEVIDVDPLVPVLASHKQSFSPEPSFLRMIVEKHNLKHNVSWFSKRIQAIPKAPRRFSTTTIKQAFLDGKSQNIRWDDEGFSLDTAEFAVLPVTQSSKPDGIDASHLIFGISTTFNRLTYDDDSLIKDWQRWLTNGRGSSNGASAVVTLHKASSQQTWEISEKLQKAGIDAIVIPQENDMDKFSRYMELVTILSDVNEALAEEGHAKRYFGLIDDDMFFPTPAQLISRLSRFDHSAPYYIGLPSERPDWFVENDTAVTYGGGAVFFTPPAAFLVSHLPCRPDEGVPANDTNWNSILHKCVATHADLPFHVLPSLYSPTDALYTMRAATFDLGISPLTLRHYKSRHRFRAGLAHLVTSVCGEACFLQRFRFADDWVLVNGYSITHYRDGLDVVRMTPGAKMLGEMQYGREAEMPLGEGIVLHDVNEKKDVVTWKGDREVWTFLDAVVGERGEVAQIYLKRKGGSGITDGESKSEDKDSLDSVIILVWES